MMQAEVMAQGFDPNQTHIVLDERAAVRHALSLAEPQDLVLICADAITAVWKEVIYFGRPGARELEG
jgi:UDP-N-acetylmuramyl tripeptide synthase